MLGVSAYLDLEISEVEQYITHSKKSPTVNFGDNWRIYLNKNLFGAKEIFSKNFELLSKYNVGFLAPSPYKRIQKDIFLKKQDKNAIYQFF